MAITIVRRPFGNGMASEVVSLGHPKHFATNGSLIESALTSSVNRNNAWAAHVARQQSAAVPIARHRLCGSPLVMQQQPNAKRATSGAAPWPHNQLAATVGGTRTLQQPTETETSQTKLSSNAPEFQCVSGDTLVWTPTGQQRIADLVTDEGVHERVIDLVTMNGLETTSQTFKHFATQLRKITLRGGMNVRCTRGHPFLTEDGWLKADDLQGGQIVLRASALPTIIRTVPTPHLWFNKGAKRREFYVPGALTTDLAWLMGFWTAEGSATAGFKREYVLWATTIPECQQRVLSILRGWGLKAEINAHRVNVYSQVFTRWWLHLMEVKGESRARNKRVPRSILCSPFTADYLRGLFRGDGSVHIAKSGHRGRRLVVNFTSLSHELTDTVQQMVIALGLHCGYAHVESRGTKFIQWSGKAAEEVVAALRLHGNIEPQTYGVGGRSRARCWQVKSVGPTPDDWVYDFTVPGSHSFIANGMIVHDTFPKHA